MKDKFLKIAGVKTEKEFYEKYPTEEEFFAKCGAKIKAQGGFWGSPGTSSMGGGGGNPVASQSWGQGINYDMGGPSSSPTSPKKNKQNGFGQFMNNFNPIQKGIDIYEKIKAQKEKVARARQTAQVLGYQEKAVASNHAYEQQNFADARNKKYVLPEDDVVTGEELFPIHGVGTNVLAKKGKKIKAMGGAMAGGNAMGGAMSNAGMGMMQNYVSTGLNYMMGEYGIGDDVGSEIGGEIGGEFSQAFGIPFLKEAGMVVGDMIDKSDDAIKSANWKSKRSLKKMAGINYGNAMQNAFSSNMKNGGKIYNSGGMLEGDVVPENPNAVKPLSYNPYTPGDGFTLQIDGDSHAEGGEDMLVNNQMVEAERGEYMHKTEDGSVNIAGNLDAPSHLKKSAETFTGEKLSGKKFKSIAKSIANAENKVNKNNNKNIDKAEDYTPLNTLDRISLNTLDLNLKLNDNKLKKLQVVKEGMAMAQQAINEFEERKPGKFSPKRNAQWGNAIPPSVNTTTVSPLPEDPIVAPETATELGKTTALNIKPREEVKSVVEPDPIDGTAKAYKPVHKDKTGLYGGVTTEGVNETIQANKNWYDFSNFDPTDKEDVMAFQRAYNARTTGRKVKVDGRFGPQTKSITPGINLKPKGITEIGPDDPKFVKYEKTNFTKNYEKEQKDKTDLPIVDALNWIPRAFKRTDAEPFDMSQLIPETWAMVNNVLEPVQAQKYQPRLRVPYDISYQEAINQNTSKARAAERLAANNPGVLANLKAAEYEADQKVLAEQFRANQAMKDQVYTQNYATLNDANLKNLAIADTQYVRQAQAKSNTKATDFEAIKSMTDKWLKHRLENRTLKVWENMYDYRYGDNYVLNYRGEPLNVYDWNSLPPNSQNTSGKTKQIYRDNEGKPYYEEVNEQGIPTRRYLRDNNTGGINPLMIPGGGFGGGQSSDQSFFAKKGNLVKKLKTYK